MKGDAFHQVIEYLGNLRCEASYRTQIGRLYYSAYWQLRQSCRERGYVPTDSGQDHERLREFIRDDLKLRHLASLLAELHKDRKRADYRDRVTIGPREVTAARSRYIEIQKPIPWVEYGRYPR